VSMKDAMEKAKAKQDDKALAKAESKAAVPVDDEESGLEQFNSRRIVNKLADLMDGVTKTEVTAENVHAACECAARITDVMRLHVEAGKLRRRVARSR
jgi:hypothetical protein